METAMGFHWDLSESRARFEKGVLPLICTRKRGDIARNQSMRTGWVLLCTRDGHFQNRCPVLN